MSRSTKNIVFRKLEYLTSGRARRFAFDDTRGLYQRVVNWIQQTFCTCRDLFYNTRSSEVVSNLDFTGPSKSQDFSAYKPVEQIGKLCPPAKNRLELEFCSKQTVPSERCQSRTRAIPSAFCHLNQIQGGGNLKLERDKMLEFCVVES